MPKDIAQRLAEKGWSQQEIDKTLNRMYSEEAQDKQEVYKQKLSPMIYWTVLLVAIIANFVFSVVMIPFFMVLTSMQLYIILGAMGLVVGLIFNLLIRELENVDYRHHIMGGVALPIIAEATIVVMVKIANAFNTVIKSEIHQSPVIISIIYVICFMTPYLIYKSYDMAAESKLKKSRGPQTPPPSVPNSQIASANPPVQPGL